jgi:hypothetical protein
MKQFKQFFAHLFLWCGTILAVICVTSTFYDGANDGQDTLAVTGAILAAAGLLALRE